MPQWSLFCHLRQWLHLGPDLALLCTFTTAASAMPSRLWLTPPSPLTASNLERSPQLRCGRQGVLSYRLPCRHVRQRNLLRHRLPLGLLARLGIVQQD